GANRHKGLAVLVFGDVEASIHPCAPTTLPWFLPVTIDRSINLLAIWACVKSWKIRYVKLSHQIVDRCEAYLANAPVAIACGDFNSNTIWDGEHGELSHSHLVGRLRALGLESAYHVVTGEPQGQETRPTQFMYRHPDKAFHLDYTFATGSLLNGTTLTVGDPAEWLAMSDHMPVVLEY
ncbi:MAG: endonuclease/exonuclease/phosphatase family protein, partial [Thermomicrobiales bacterium]